MTSAPRTKFTTVDEYIGNFPASVQELLERIRTIFRETAPEAVESISYQIPAYKLKGKNILHFAAFKDHIGLYPRNWAMEAFFKDRLLPYSTGKATIQFPLNQPMPYDLIEELVAFQVERITAKKK